MPNAKKVTIRLCSAPDFVDTKLMVTGWCAG